MCALSGALSDALSGAVWDAAASGAAGFAECAVWDASAGAVLDAGEEIAEFTNMCYKGRGGGK